MLSIDLGDKRIKILESEVGRRSIRIRKEAVIEMPLNSYNDGEILNMISIKTAVEKVLRENKIKAKKAHISINSSNIITKKIKFSYVKKKNIKNVVLSEMEQYLPLPLEAYIIEHRILFLDKEEVEVEIYVIQRDTAIKYIELCDELKVQPKVLDTHGNSLKNLIKKTEYLNNETDMEEDTAFVDIGEKSITFSAFKGRVQKFTRVIQCGYSEIYKGSFYSAGIQEDIEGIIQELHEKGISFHEEGEGEKLVRCVGVWCEEIERLLNYSRSNLKLNHKKLYIYGGASRIGGVDYLMEKFLYMEVKRIESILLKGMKDPIEEPGMFLNNIGITFWNRRKK